MALATGVCFAQQLRVGVFRDFTVTKIVLAYEDGSYNVMGDSTDYATILPNEFVELTWLPENRISLKVNGTVLDTVSKVELFATKLGSSLVYSTKIPVTKERKYHDDVEIFPNDKGLTIVNLVDMENYLGGVVESEGGNGHELEYYKVQALMSRTYALKYKDKHAKEGFGLCDGVHCQAYHYQLRFNPKIDSAIVETDGMVMVDENNKLVDAYFHANCGGQTSEPDYIWNSKVPYLNSFRDTFCIYTRQANWEKHIPQQEWRDYLVDTFHYPIDDTIIGPMVFNFTQSERAAFYQYPWLGIPLRDIRAHFGLKSTFFTCYPEGEDVVLRGRGYGHGVGLCQEGAMRMARYHFNYLQIALYYFPGVRVVNYREQEYFNQHAGM